ncbi:ABC transporter ATP-binding protein [Bauldia sp.]|uniref:ABC transporter ATP-binding protein n=1 Tax=Bauldia sp. TaxID=2575872 RepID=UPI003BAC78BB
MQSLVIDSVTKHYGAFQALENVGFTVEQGEFIVMVGPSGCGKSTLLRIIAGLEAITAGRILINDHDVTDLEPADRGVAMVFQNYALYPHMTVAQNMGFGLKMLGRPRAEVEAAVVRAAEVLKITEHLAKRPKQLSGGQKQRVAIGRAITRSPDVFLFDEPLSNLDAALRSQMRVELSRLHSELAATMIYVTHDQTEAMTMADRIVVINDGVIEQIGSPLDLYNRPGNLFVAGFLGSPRMNFFPATVADGTDDSTVAVNLAVAPAPLRLAAPDGNGTPPSIGTDIVVGVRPESFREEVTNGAVTVDATVKVVESLGRETLLYVDGGPLTTVDSESQDGYIAVHRAHQSASSYGATMRLAIDPRDVFVFASDGATLRFPERQSTAV